MERVPDRREFSPVVALLTVSGMWDAELNAQLKPIGLTTRRYGLLAHIRATPGISFSELARRSQITVQTAHTAVRSLVVDGLVADATAHAGAASDLRTTERGLRALADADAVIAALDTRLAAGAPTLTGALQSLQDEPLGEQAAPH